MLKRKWFILLELDFSVPVWINWYSNPFLKYFDRLNSYDLCQHNHSEGSDERIISLAYMCSCSIEGHIYLSQIIGWNKYRTPNFSSI